MVADMLDQLLQVHEEEPGGEFYRQMIFKARLRFAARVLVIGAAIALLFHIHHVWLAILPFLALSCGWDVYRVYIRIFDGREAIDAPRPPWLPLQMALAKTSPLWLALAIILWLGGW